MSSPQSDIEQSKRDVINSLPEECRTVGTSFFQCLEKSAHDAQTKNLNEEQYQEFMVSTAVPGCLKEFNLEDCLEKNDKNQK